MKIAILRLLVVLSLSVFGQPAATTDWTQWRGPNRNGHVPAALTPQTWPASFAPSWRVEIGEGYSSPVIAAGRVFTHSRRDPNEVVTAVDATNGKVLWQREYPATFTKNQYASRMAKGPNATPLVSGNRLYTLGVTGILIAWDVASGKEIWRQDYSAAIDTSKLFCGTAGSPLLANGLLIVQVGSDIHGGRILALDPATGASRWEWKGPGPGYASPIIINDRGMTQIVTLTNSSIVGLDVRDGLQLWSVPFTDEWHENIVTPVWTGTALIVSGTRQGTQAYRLTASLKSEKTEGGWQATQLWKNTEASMYMSSPVYADDLIYGFSDKRKGHFVALDVKTGKAVWTTEGREGAHASVLLTPQHVIYLTSGADLVVARRGARGFEIEKKYDVANAETWAVPVFLGNDLIVRDTTSVIRLKGTG